jgi:hypothetical protein
MGMRTTSSGKNRTSAFLKDYASVTKIKTDEVLLGEEARNGSHYIRDHIDRLVPCRHPAG